MIIPSWVKPTALVLALGLSAWAGYRAGAANGKVDVAELKESVATTVNEKRDAEIKIQYETKVEYVDRIKYVTQWKTKTEKELVYVSQPLAQCPVPDDAVRLYNEARGCALQADASGCRVDIEMRSAGVFGSAR